MVEGTPNVRVLHSIHLLCRVALLVEGVPPLVEEAVLAVVGVEVVEVDQALVDLGAVAVGVVGVVVAVGVGHRHHHHHIQRIVVVVDVVSRRSSFSALNNNCIWIISCDVC